MNKQKNKAAIVVTTIASPNDILKEIATKAKELDFNFFVIGDVPSPKDFRLDGADFYDIARQEASDFKFALECPKRHYARKNIGYLLAIRDRASFILETDDDNLPGKAFWQKRERMHTIPVIEKGGWVNVYRYFTSVNIWPRGFALEELKNPFISLDSLKPKKTDCPIQQGMADESPDVDAIYPLTMPLPVSFEKTVRLGLYKTWCPFNSQNTTWWPETFPLLYLPSYSTFRLTDIWRSFIVQRIAWENNWTILFHESTVQHKRNYHNLIKDFEQEIPGYLNNRKICEALEKLTLKAGVQHLSENLYLCYEKIVSLGLLDAKELTLLELWLSDIKTITPSGHDLATA